MHCILIGLASAMLGAIFGLSAIAIVHVDHDAGTGDVDVDVDVDNLILGDQSIPPHLRHDSSAE